MMITVAGGDELQIGLIDVDGHNFPNLALMKISAYHKARGDAVEWWNGLKHYDRVYQSKVFDDTYTPDNEYCIQADEVVKGGTGYGLDNKLPDEIEHIMPDYSLYGITNLAVVLAVVRSASWLKKRGESQSW